MSFYIPLAQAAFQGIHFDPVNDGFIGYLIRNNFTTLESTTFWRNYYNETVSPHYLPACVIIFIIFIGVILVVLTCFVWLHCRDGRRISKTKRSRSHLLIQPVTSSDRHSDDSAYQQVTDSSHPPMSSSRDQEIKVFQCQYYMIWVIILVLLLFIVHGLILQSHFMSQILSKQSSSVKGTIATVIDKINEFLDDFSGSGFLIIQDTAQFFIKDVLRLLQETIHALADELFEKQGVNELFLNAENLITVLGKVIDTMSSIKQMERPFHDQIVKYETNLNNMKSDFSEKLKNICSRFTQLSQLETDCRFIQETLPQVEIHLNRSLLNFESTTSVLFVTSQYQINVTSIGSELEKGKKAVDKILHDAYSSLVGGVNVASVQMILNTHLDSIRNQILLFQNTTLHPLKTSPQVNRWFLLLSLFFLLLFIIPVTCFLTYSLVCCCFLLVESSYFLYLNIRWCTSLKNKLFRSQTTENEEQYIPMRTITEGSHDGSRRKRISKCRMNGREFSYRYYYRLSIVIIGLSLFPIVGLSLTFAASGLGYNELCVQTTSEKGTSQLDEALSKYLNGTWNDLMDQMVNTSDMMQQLFDYVDLQPPRDIFLILYNGCSKYNDSLIRGLGYDVEKSIDIQGLLNSPPVQDVVSTGRNYVEKEVGKLDMRKLLPNDIQSVLSSSKDLIKAAIDGINHDTTIHELNKPFLTIGQFNDSAENYFIKVDEIMNKLHDVEPTSRDIFTLLMHTNRMVTENQHSLLSIQTRQRFLHSNFTYLQNNRQLVMGIDKLVNSLLNVQQTFADTKQVIFTVGQIYEEVVQDFKEKVEPIILSILQTFQSTLFHCRFLHEAFKTSTENTCNNIILHLATLAIQSALIVILVQFLLGLVAFHLSLRRRIKRLQFVEDVDSNKMDVHLYLFVFV